MQFVVVRLGKDSLLDIERLDDVLAPGKLPFNFTFVCTQVEEGIGAGDIAFIWLGSDNNKGQATSWKQGLRAIGRIVALDRGAQFNDESNITIEIVSVFSKSIDQFDFLERSASHYKYFSSYPVVGVRSSRNNAIQKVNEGERRQTTALLSALDILLPELKGQLLTHAPELIALLNFSPVGEIQMNTAPTTNTLVNDEVWKWISHQIFQKNERNFLFLGAPGTGKTWYANEIAKHLTLNSSERLTFVQFHPSFSYDDFVEGYTPTLNGITSNVEYTLLDKHFLSLCSKAKGDGSNLYVLVIDELTRGDPSRIFGELLTYLETSHRNREFSLAYSRRKFFVPDNVVLIATANPYDRSVGELDDALMRRFSVREFKPNSNALEKHLQENGVDKNFQSRLLHTFKLLNDKLVHGLGQSHFWNVRDANDFLELWNSRVSFVLKRAFQFDEDGFAELEREVTKVFPLLNEELAQPDGVKPSPNTGGEA